MKHSSHESSIRKNTVLGLILSGIEYGYPVLIFVCAARVLHPEGLGRISLAASVTAYFALFTGLGMPIYGLREAAKLRDDSEKRAELAAELLLIRALSGAAAWLVFLAAERLIFGGGENHRLLMIFGLSILTTIPDCAWLFKGMEEYRPLAWISAAVRLAGAAAVFLLVRSPGDLNVFAWISVLVPAAVSLAELILADRRWHLRLLPRCGKILAEGKILQTVRRHIRPLMLFLLMSCAVTVYSHMDIVMLGMLKDERTVGLYSCGARIKSLLPVLTGTLWTAALPRAERLWREKRKDEFAALAGKSFHAVDTVLIPLTVYFFLFAEPWLRLIGGAEYLEAAPTMRLLLAAVIPIGFSNILGGQMLIPMGQEKKLFHAELIGAAANLLLNAALIPLYAAPGAAAATAFSEILVAAAAGAAVRKQVKAPVLRKKTLLRTLAGCAAAGLAAAGAAGFLPESSALKGPVSFLVFAAVFAVTLFFLGDAFYTELFLAGRRFCPAFIRTFWNRTLRSRLEKAGMNIRRIVFRAGMALFPGKRSCYCPCCGVRFASFTEGDYAARPETFNPSRYAGIRQDVLCPVCGSLPRHRILASWCEARLPLFRGSDILYFAPEKGMMLWLKRNHISCTTADLYQAADLHLDIQETGLPDASRDIIICNHVLEHVEDFRKALREMHRILRSGGLLICSFPIDPSIEVVEEAEGPLSAEERLRRFGQADHLRVFGRNADRLLEEAGFSVTRISGKTEPAEILPITGPADYDINELFACKKATGDEGDRRRQGTVPRLLLNGGTRNAGTVFFVPSVY